MKKSKEYYDFTQGISEAIMETTGCHVTIANEQSVRIAGTGVFKRRLGEKIPENSAYQKAMKEKEIIIISDPGSDSSCINCPNSDVCIEKYEICTPIMNSEDEVLGVVGIIATTDEQKEYILERQGGFIEYLNNMAILLGTYITESRLRDEIEIKNEELNAIIDNTANAVICITADGKINYINKNVLELLDIKRSIDSLKGKDISVIWKDSLLEKSIKGYGNSKIFEEEVFETKSGEKKLISSHIIKIYENDKIVSVVGTFADSVKLQTTAAQYRDKSVETTFDTLIGNSKIFKETKAKAKIAANYDSNVLITGESGTGKELFARAIHDYSDRRDYPFVSINCSAIPETLLESELFGYVGGAFTDAKRGGKLGKMEIADEGTFFLDEIGDMTLYLQSKLLRVLQDMTIVRVGGTKSIKLDLKIICATNQNLEELVRKGRFREDLYYRINVIPLKLPPLRERISDIETLAYYFINLNNKRFNKNIQGLDKEAIKIMESYSWPGNIRELENIIEYLANFKDSGLITADDVRTRINLKEHEDLTLDEMVREFEQRTIEELLNQYGNDEEGKKKAAEKLNISRATLYRKLKNE